MDKILRKDKEKGEPEGQYICDECRINFGNSIGDMERHKLTVHLQQGDTELE
jgi:hypothetical protein